MESRETPAYRIEEGEKDPSEMNFQELLEEIKSHGYGDSNDITPLSFDIHAQLVSKDSVSYSVSRSDYPDYFLADMVESKNVEQLRATVRVLRTIQDLDKPIEPEK